MKGTTNLKRTTLMTILAMGLALGASRADMPAGTNKPAEHHSVAKWMQVGAEGAIGGNDPLEQQKPVRSKLPGNADREEPPVLMAPHCSSCIKNASFPTWQQLQMAMSVLYWI